MIRSHHTTNEILSKEWQKPGQVIIFSWKWAFWAVQAGSIPKKYLKLKYATFEGGFFHICMGKKYFNFSWKYCNVRTKKLHNNSFMYIFYLFFSLFVCVKIGYKFGPNLVYVLRECSRYVFEEHKYNTIRFYSEKNVIGQRRICEYWISCGPFFTGKSILW